MGHLTTPAQDRTLRALAAEFGLIQIDHEGTSQVRRRNGETALVTCFYADLPDGEIRYWLIDIYGDILVEAGARPE